ncbi:MAG: MaoC family dehydratase [Betaproteobacteria bacterium]|nr:MaoC family dehydratase [Betaproteobacteria bacterium]
MDDDWKQAWQPLVEAVGQDFSEGKRYWGADCVEKGGIRRFLEPLEFDCPLHYDDAIARRHGYGGVIAPFSSYLSLTIPAIWRPGKSVFTSAEPHAQPESDNPIAGIGTKLAPPTSGYFATDLEIEYLKPVLLGDRLCRAGRKLLSCEPKETKVGCGAFTCWETEIRNQDDEIVALLRLTVFSYNPHPEQ